MKKPGILIFALALLFAACGNMDDLFIRPDRVLISGSGAQATEAITVVSSIDWRVVIPEDEKGVQITWITADKITGRAGDTNPVTFTINANTGVERSAVVSLTGDGASARITITQSTYTPPTPPAQGTLTAAETTNHLYLDIGFVPFEETGSEEPLLHKLFFVGQGGVRGEVAAEGTASENIFRVNITEWGICRFIYEAGRMVGGEFVSENGFRSDVVTVTFTEPAAAVLTINEKESTQNIKVLVISESPEGVTLYQLFKDGEITSSNPISAETAKVEVQVSGIYSVNAILSREGIEPIIYGSSSNEAEVTIIFEYKPLGDDLLKPNKPTFIDRFETEG